MTVRKALTIVVTVICLASFAASTPQARAAAVDLMLSPASQLVTGPIGCPDNTIVMVSGLKICDYNTALGMNAYYNCISPVFGQNCVQGGPGLVYSGTAVATNFNGLVASEIDFTGPPPVPAPASFLPVSGFTGDGYIGDLLGVLGGFPTVDILATHVQRVPPGLPIINRAEIIGATVFFPNANPGNASITVTANATGCPTVAVIANIPNPGIAGALVTLPNLIARRPCGIFQGTNLTETGDLMVTVNNAVVFFATSPEVSVDIVPEPGTLFMFSAGIFTLMISYRQHQKATRREQPAGLVWQEWVKNH
jgi:hypothetical protein